MLEVEADEDVVSVHESTLEVETAGDGEIDADGESVRVDAGEFDGLRDIDGVAVDESDTRGL